MSDLPLTGAEPVYQPKPWNKNEQIRKTNNCYSYFLQDLQRGRKTFPHPGGLEAHRQYETYVKNSDPQGPNFLSEGLQSRSNLYKAPHKKYKCDEIEEGVLLDNPNVYKVQESERCEDEYYKGYLAVDEGQRDRDKYDYHFWIQNSEGKWSHKPGQTRVRDVDFSNQKIMNPRLSDRGRYKSDCSYFCIPKDDSKKEHVKKRLLFKTKEVHWGKLIFIILLVVLYGAVTSSFFVLVAKTIYTNSQKNRG